MSFQTSLFCWTQHNLFIRILITKTVVCSIDFHSVICLSYYGRQWGPGTDWLTTFFKICLLYIYIYIFIYHFKKKEIQVTAFKKNSRHLMCFGLSFTQQQHLGAKCSQRVQRFFKHFWKRRCHVYYVFSLQVYVTRSITKWHRQLLVWHVYTAFLVILIIDNVVVCMR